MKKVLLYIVISCLISTVYGQSRVTGGYEIDIEEAPWQVLLQGAGCGGSIVGEKWVLTAKHCTNENITGVSYGITTRGEASSSNTIRVKRIINHPDYNVDLALLELEQNIPDYFSRIAYIPTDKNIAAVGISAMVSGWGWLTPNGYDPAYHLNAANVHVISNNNEIISSLGWNIKNWEIVTTGVGSVRKGACHGDSGGPLITKKDNFPYLIGVVSWGRIECPGTNNNSPSVYVRVDAFSDWIYTYVPKIIPLAISPSSSIFCDEAVFSINNLPADASVSWSSPNLTLVTGQGTSRTIFKANTYNGNTTVKASVKVGTQIYPDIVSPTVWLGSPTLTKVGPAISLYGEMPKIFEEGECYNFGARGQGAETVDWSAWGYATILESDKYNVKIRINSLGDRYGDGIFTLTAKAYNRCGSTTEQSFTGTVKNRRPNGGGIGGGGDIPLRPNERSFKVNDMQYTVQVYNAITGICIYNQVQSSPFNIYDTDLEKGIYIVVTKDIYGDITREKIMKN